jgi:mannose-6-phosphate isomerase-like protein (cupin superfamily)
MSSVITEVAHKVDQAGLETVHVLGPTLRYVTEPRDDSGPCLLIGTIPPGVIVPLHSHADPETFVVTSGEIEALAHRSDEDFEWLRLRPGDVFDVPPCAKHGFRNVREEPAVMYIVSTGRIGRFFREVGDRVTAGRPPAPVSREALERFLTVAARYGYWNATPEENARVGINLSL